MEVVEVLFPVTRRHPMILDWSVHGIVRYVDSAAYKERVCHIAVHSIHYLSSYQGYLKVFLFFLGDTSLL
jgi:hypothetical protein